MHPLKITRMEAIQDRIKSELGSTQFVTIDGNTEKLQDEVIETVLEAIQGEALVRLQALDDPICVGPTTNGELLFVDKGKRPYDLHLQSLESDSLPKTAGEYVNVRQQALSEGVRLVTPLEARLVERATGDNFSPWSDSFATSMLESEGQPHIFSTHPTWEYYDGNFMIGSASGSHIQCRDAHRGAWTRRGVSIPVNLPVKTVKSSGDDSPGLSSLLREYQRRFLNDPVIHCQKSPHTQPSGDWHMDWPSLSAMRHTLYTSEPQIGRMSDPFIQKVGMGRVEVVNNAMISICSWDKPSPFDRITGEKARFKNLMVMESQRESVRQVLPLIFPGEWRLAR